VNCENLSNLGKRPVPRAQDWSLKRRSRVVLILNAIKPNSLPKSVYCTTSVTTVLRVALPDAALTVTE